MRSGPLILRERAPASVATGPCALIPVWVHGGSAPVGGRARDRETGPLGCQLLLFFDHIDTLVLDGFPISENPMKSSKPVFFFF